MNIHYLAFLISAVYFGQGFFNRGGCAYMMRSTKLELVVSVLHKMQEQKLSVFFSCLVGFATVYSLKSGGELPRNVQPTVAFTFPTTAKPFTLPPGYTTPVPRIPIEPVDVILKQQSEIKPDGSYNWSYETQHGIKAEESGSPVDTKDSRKVATGSFQYTAPDDTLIAVKYVADENGFRAEGAHLPTPPPIPVEIARALKWIAAHPQSNK